jgi:gamma-glutamylcyclotransferase (GGCT)/AIG2-like uncharacterized protein YtfP
LNTADHLSVPVFVYGTLKRGGRYHAYCRGGLMVAEARVEGVLYDLLEGYPALVVPEATVLAVGTDDPAADAREAKRLARQHLTEPGPPTVHGELYAFDDPDDRLPALDALEEFLPEDPASPYRRVLVPVLPVTGGVTPAWTYAARGPRGMHLPGGRWPA